MINFKEMQLTDEIHNILDNLEISFAFQPIFRLDDMSLIGYEALMRPKDKTPLELIDEYSEKGELHTVELATLFGAWQAYQIRGYETLLSVNSFPEVCLTDEECDFFHQYFPEAHISLVLEILEYTSFNQESWNRKKKHLTDSKIRTVIDDFGVGNNTDVNIVDIYDSVMVKLDRKLVAGIDTNKELQKEVVEYINAFHKKNVLVLAECVETEEELNYLKSVGVDFAQGYYLGRPA